MVCIGGASDNSLGVLVYTLNETFLLRVLGIYGVSVGGRSAGLKLNPTVVPICLVSLNQRLPKSTAPRH